MWLSGGMKYNSALFGLVVAGSLALGACSFSTGSSPSSTAEEVIEDALAEQAGMTFTDADCEMPADDEVGTGFSCTAMNTDDATITFDAVIDPDEMIFVAPTNLVYADDMALVEAEAAQTLGPEIGVEIDPADVDCPDETTVLDDDELRCEITDAETGDRYELIVMFDGFTLREGYNDRLYTVGDQVR